MNKMENKLVKKWLIKSMWIKKWNDINKKIEEE